MSLRTSSSKRQRREGDDQREEQSFTVNDFEFENLVTQFVGGMALISYQKPKEQEKVMICVKDPKFRKVKETELVEAQHAMDQANKTLQGMKKFVADALENISVTETKLGIAQSLLDRVQSTDNADSLQPCEYTTDTIDTLCDKIDFLTWTLEDMAKQLKFISTDDIKDIPDKGVLTYLLRIAQVRPVKYCIYFVDLYTNLLVFWPLQQKKMYRNQSFITHMKALNNEGVFHQGSFDMNRIVKRTHLTKESAQVYVSIIFNVDGWRSDGRPSEEAKFAPRYRQIEGQPWSHWTPEMYEMAWTPQAPSTPAPTHFSFQHQHSTPTSYYPYHTPTSSNFSQNGAPASPFPIVMTQAPFGYDPSPRPPTAYMHQADAATTASAAPPNAAMPTANAPTQAPSAYDPSLRAPTAYMHQADAAAMASAAPPNAAMPTANAPFSFFPGTPNGQGSGHATPATASLASSMNDQRPFSLGSSGSVNKKKPARPKPKTPTGSDVTMKM
jgi:hypothetical protein